MKSSDERLPFTCKITGEDCGAMISHIYLSATHADSLLESKTLGIIPVSPDVLDLLTRRKSNKLTSLIKNELKKIVKE